MSEPEVIEPSPIVQTPKRAIRLEYVPLGMVKHWDRNPKLHDIGALVQSIELHGFRDPPSYDATLDGIVEGNGRIEALVWMRDQSYSPPEGIGEVIDSQSREVIDWAVPIIFGLDAPSRAAAERYGLDHNNLVMMGGDFTAVDVARTYSAEYLELVVELAREQMLPVSVTGDDVDTLLALAQSSTPTTIDLGYSGEHTSELAEGDQFDDDAQYAVTIPLSQEQANDTNLKAALQQLCSRFGLKHRIAKR